MPMTLTMNRQAASNEATKQQLAAEKKTQELKLLDEKQPLQILETQLAGEVLTLQNDSPLKKEIIAACQAFVLFYNEMIKKAAEATLKLMAKAFALPQKTIDSVTEFATTVLSLEINRVVKETLGNSPLQLSDSDLLKNIKEKIEKLLDFYNGSVEKIAQLKEETIATLTANSLGKEEATKLFDQLSQTAQEHLNKAKPSVQLTQAANELARNSEPVHVNRELGKIERIVLSPTLAPIYAGTEYKAYEAAAHRMLPKSMASGTKQEVAVKVFQYNHLLDIAFMLNQCMFDNKSGILESIHHHVICGCGSSS